MATKSERIQELKDPNSFYFKSVENFLKKIVAEQARDAGSLAASEEGGEKKIPYAIRGEEVTRLSKEFGWKMTVSPREFSRVPFAASKVFCANLLNESIKSWSGEEVVHLEGDITTMAARRQHWKHICRAGATSRQLSEYARQDISLRRMTTGQNSHVAALAHQLMVDRNVGGVSGYCDSAKTCRKVCDTVVYDLAKADIPASQSAITILQHGAVRSKTWFFFETLMLYEDEGALTSMNGRFYVDRAGDRLYVIPEGRSTEDSIEYTWSNILSYISKPTITVQGQTFLIEIHDSVPGTYFVSVADARGECEYEVRSEHRLYHPAGEKIVEVSQRMVFPKTANAGRGFHDVTVRVPQDMWEKVVARLLAVKENRLTMAEARVAVADYSQQRVDVGALIRAPRSLPYDVPEVFARAAWKFTAAQRLRMAMESSLAREGIRAQWDGTLQRLVATGIRVMHEQCATVGDFLLGVANYVGVVDAQMEDYEVSVRIADTSEVASEIVLSREPALQAAYPGGPYFDAGSATDSSEIRASLKRRAMDVYREIQMLNSELAEVSNTTSAEMQAEDYDSGEEVFYSAVSEVSGSERELSTDRERLVDKMVHVYDVNLPRPVGRVSETLPSIQEPVCSVEVCTNDPVGVLQTEYNQFMPSMSSYDADVTPYLFGEADKTFDIDVARMVSNARKDELPRNMKVRKSKLKTGCSGKRPQTQSETMLAFTKRVANAPVLAAEVVYHERLASDFQQFQAVMLRDGWQERMKAAVASGLWQLDLSELRKHVAKLETTAIGKMIDEQFRTGNIDMSSWVAMVKSTVKPKVSESVASSYGAPQTIIYQHSKLTNSMFSPVLSKFLDFLDQETLPWIRLNARRDRSDDERWANSMEFRTTQAAGAYQDVEADISQMDKSQCLYNMMLFFYILKQFGAPEELTSVWEVMMGVKRANAIDVGMAVWYVYQVVSGFFGTIAANTLITAVSNVVCLRLRPDDVIRAEIRGDDALFRVRRQVNVAEATEDFATRFNMEAKIFVGLPPYFCSAYEVKVDGYLFRIRDPEKIRESLGRFVSSSATLDEMHESFVDSARHYEKKEVLDALAEAVRKRTGAEVRGSLRAISSIAQKRELFEDCYDSDYTVIGF